MPIELRSILIRSFTFYLKDGKIISIGLLSILPKFRANRVSRFTIDQGMCFRKIPSPFCIYQMLFSGVFKFILLGNSHDYIGPNSVHCGRNL